MTRVASNGNAKEIGKKHRLLTSWSRRDRVEAAVVEGTDGAIGRIPILVSNSGVPCVSSRARDSALQRKNASRSRLRLDGCEIARRYVTSVVVEARRGTPPRYSLLASRGRHVSLPFQSFLKERIGSEGVR